jgi:hypothetical protein
MEAIVYDSLVPITVPVKLGEKDFVLVEASEEASMKYRDKMTTGMTFVDGKPNSMPTGAIEAEAALVAGCLFECYTDKGETKHRPVSLPYVLKLPRRIVRDLFDRAKEISGIDVDSVEVIEKQIARLTEQLARIKEGGAKN